MGRKQRQDFDYAFHHVMNRASAKRFSFANVTHRKLFFRVLRHVVSTDDIEVHAYCLDGPKISRCLNRSIVDRSYYLVPASLTDILNEVIMHYQISREKLLSCRTTVKNIPRDVCMFIAREEACMKILDIADFFGIRKAAASTALLRVKEQMRLNTQFSREVTNLQNRIRIGRLQVPSWTTISQQK